MAYLAARLSYFYLSYKWNETQLLFSLKSGIILKSPQICFCPWEMDEKQTGNVVTSRRVVAFINFYTKSFCQFPLKLNSIPKDSL